MTTVLATTENVKELALAYLDKETESLVEVSEEDFFITVTAKQSSIKRFYLIGELLYDHKITVKAESLDPLQYILKVKIGNEFPRLSDFVEYTNTDSTVYQGAAFKYLNALPLDIYAESLVFSNLDVTINLEVEVEALQ